MTRQKRNRYQTFETFAPHGQRADARGRAARRPQAPACWSGERLAPFRRQEKRKGRKQMKLRNRYFTQTASRRWRPGRQPACLQTPPRQDAYLHRIQVALGDGRPRDAAAGLHDAADRLKLALIFPFLLPNLAVICASAHIQASTFKAGVSGDPRRRCSSYRFADPLSASHRVAFAGSTPRRTRSRCGRRSAACARCCSSCRCSSSNWSFRGTAA